MSVTYRWCTVEETSEFVATALMTFQKTGATVFLNTLLDFCMTHGGVAVITHLCDTGRSNLTTSWSFIQTTRHIAPPLQPGCLCVSECVYVALHYIIPLSPCRIALTGVFSICRPLHVADKLFRCALIKRRNTTWLLSWGGGVYTHTDIMQQVLCIGKKNVKLCLVLWPGLCSKIYRFTVKNMTSLPLIFVSSLNKNISDPVAAIQDVINTAGRSDVIFGAHLCPIPSSLSSLIISQILEIFPPVLLPSSFPLHSVSYFFPLECLLHPHRVPASPSGFVTHSHVSLPPRFLWFNSATWCLNEVWHVFASVLSSCFWTLAKIYLPPSLISTVSFHQW